MLASLCSRQLQGIVCQRVPYWSCGGMSSQRGRAIIIVDIQRGVRGFLIPTGLAKYKRFRSGTVIIIIVVIVIIIVLIVVGIVILARRGDKLKGGSGWSLRLVVENRQVEGTFSRSFGWISHFLSLQRWSGNFFRVDDVSKKNPRKQLGLIMRLFRIKYKVDRDLLKKQQHTTTARFRSSTETIHQHC